MDRIKWITVPEQERSCRSIYCLDDLDHCTTCLKLAPVFSDRLKGAHYSFHGGETALRSTHVGQGNLQMDYVKLLSRTFPKFCPPIVDTTWRISTQTVQSGFGGGANRNKLVIHFFRCEHFQAIMEEKRVK